MVSIVSVHVGLRKCLIFVNCVYLILSCSTIISKWDVKMKSLLFSEKKLTSSSQIIALGKYNKISDQSVHRYNKNLLYVLAFWLVLLALSVVAAALRRAARPPPAERAADRVVSCYYNTPDPQEHNQLLPASIHPHLCTHINVAFAQIKDKKIHLDDHQYQCLAEVVSLKKLNPKLKILLSIGGAGDGSGFPEMVVNHASRKVFIQSIKSVLRNHSLDGVDLDWEFPGVHDYQSTVRKRERQHFSQLLREIRMEYIREKRDYLLTVAVAAPQIIVDAAYDVDQINLYVDYVNIMTYDFHYFTEFTPFTGLNSPLYARAEEQLYMATLNINYTVHMYMDKGLDTDKIVVGVPTYGHSFNLVNANNGKIGSPASGLGDLGQLGFVNYPDICQFIKSFYNVSVHFDSEASVPYLHRGHVWASFDNPESVMFKAKYIMENKLRGAMIYSLNADDYRGLCARPLGSTKFPLAVSVKNALRISHTDKELHDHSGTMPASPTPAAAVGATHVDIEGV